MMIYKIKLFLFIFSFIYCFVISLSWAENKKINEIDKSITKEKIQLNNLKKKILKQNIALSKMGEKKYSILKKQKILDNQLKIRERELKIYNWNLIKNKKKIKSLVVDINENKKKLNQQHLSMTKRLRSIYKEGSMYSVKLLFSSDSFTDLLTRVNYMERIAAYDSELFASYKKQINLLNKKKKGLLSAKSDLLQFKKYAELKKNEIRTEKRKKKQFLARLSKERKFNERIKLELLGATKTLDQLIARLERKKNLGEGIDITDKKGRLLPPVKGKVLNVFGRKRDKQFDTYIVYNGINISSPKGVSVRAVFDGKILYTGTLEGYGNIIIIGHGKGYHSLYGHLDEIITQVGKNIRIGQIIARSGDTGSIMGESLYFEMRHNGKPIEPTVWLSQSK